MSNHGQPAQRSIQTFQPTASPLGGIVPTGLTALGGGLTALAAALAVVPPNAALGKIVQTLDRVGLDKGPLFLFGVGIAGVGLALRGQRRAQAASSGGASMDAVADLISSEIESVNAILGGVQVDVNAIRSDVHETRREVTEANSTNDSDAGEANNPMFRLAASLDQLGARVDKRMDAARKEMLGAVQAVAAKVDAAQAAEPETSDDMDIIRDEIAAVRVAVAELTKATKEREEAARKDEERRSESAPSLPKELDEHETQAASPVAATPSGLSPVAPTASAPPAPALPNRPEPVPQATMPGAPTLPPGFTAVPAAGNDQEPAPPVPMPREGLELIDDMDTGRANLADVTPPLFPELGGSDH